jgi:SAM-dependent methyltransferase
MTVRHLARVVPAPPGKPLRSGSDEARERSRRIATDPASWSRAEADDVVATYADLATGWDVERGGYRPVPVRDALARGGPWPSGRCLDVGSGTGLLDPVLRTVWSEVLAVDLSPDMLARSAAPCRVRADASRLPVRTGSAAAVVLGDAPLFAAEVTRVLTTVGAVLWSNALGRDAPHHVPAAIVLQALIEADPARSWTAVDSDAGWGWWAVFRSR